MENKKNQEMLKKLNDIAFGRDINSLFNINVQIINRNNLPGIQLRKTSTDMDVIKQLIKSTLNNEPIVLMPRFYDQTKSIDSMLKKGIIFWDENKNEFNFNF